MNRILLALLAALAAAAAPAQQPALPTVQLAAGMHAIRAEVADNMAARTQGLMFRKAMGANDGMLFVFEESSKHCMWMKNTLIPLSVAFIDDAGIIVTILEMQPHDETSRCATQPARYALEMNQGWFARRGVKPGVKLRGLEKLSPR
jgi:hypothetical protein